MYLVIPWLLPFFVAFVEQFLGLRKSWSRGFPMTKNPPKKVHIDADQLLSDDSDMDDADGPEMVEAPFRFGRLIFVHLPVVKLGDVVPVTSPERCPDSTGRFSFKHPAIVALLRFGTFFQNVWSPTLLPFWVPV